MVLAFMCVGISGIFVNTGILWALVNYDVPLAIAGALATESAIISNFFLNESWTFKKVMPHLTLSQRFISFNLVSFFGLLISVGTMLMLTWSGMYYIYANLVGIFVAFIWNYLVNRSITWNQQ